MNLYKIQNVNSGLFSKGGMQCASSYYGSYSWSKSGKIWTGSGAIRRHLNLYVDQIIKGIRTFNIENIPSDWMVIEIILDIKAQTCFTKCYPAREFYAASKLTTLALQSKSNSR